MKFFVNKFIFCLFFLTILFFSSLNNAFASNDLNSAFRPKKLGYSASKMGFNVSTSTQTPEAIVGTIISTILGLLGVIFGILIIYGGFLWMTAGGNDQEVEKAQKIIKNAAVGLFVVLLSYALSWLVLSMFVDSGPNLPQ